MLDAYQQWKAAQQPNFFEDGAGGMQAPLFSRAVPVAPTSGISEAGLKPVLGSNAAGYVDTAGVAQKGFTSPASSMDWGTMAGAGIGAAGQAAAGIAQAAANKQILDNWVGGQAANRASSERMARAQLEQNAAQFQTAQKMNAYNQLLAALSNGTLNESSKRSLNRSIANSGANGLTTAYLG